MEIIGSIILYIIMVCCAIGALATIFKEESGLAQSFHEGIGTMAALFIPICGLMVSVPYLIIGVEKLFGSLFRSIGADPVIAASMILPPDAGGYALALAMGQGPAVTVISMLVGFMVASTVAFNIPIGLSVLKKEDHNYLALGAMSGFLAAPVGIFTSYMVMYFTKPTIRTTFTTVGASDYVLELEMLTIFINLIPIVTICVFLALGLKFFPEGMIKGFKIFGKVLTSVLTLVVMASILQHYTGVFSSLFGSWHFDPLFADEKELFRAIELLGTIAMMLTGAFPMVYLIRKYCNKPLEKLGKFAGLSSTGSAGLVASLANGLALFPLIGEMKPTDKVVTIAFMICAGYSLGDFIAFNVNFQPNLVFAIFVGQIFGGIVGIGFAKLIAVPQVLKMMAENEAINEMIAESKIINEMMAEKETINETLANSE